MSDLIDRLATDLRPTPRAVVSRRLLIGSGVGVALSVIVTVVVLGLRPDLAAAAADPMFWAKFAYPAALAVVGLAACERLGRPAAKSSWRLAALALPLGAIALGAASQLAAASPAQRMPMVMGHSASLCPWLIVAVSSVSLAGMLWALRGLAPTRLRLTGALAGLAAGGLGAAAYALHCDEQALAFVGVWYSLGIAIVAALGALVGPRALRW